MSGSSDPKIGNTEAQKMMAEIAAKKWQDYQTIHVPMENKFMADVQKMDSAQAMDEAQAIAGITNASETTKAIDNTAKAMSEGGVNPNSTKFTDTVNDAANHSAKASNENSNNVETAQQDRFVSGLGGVNAMANGKEAGAVAGLNDVAQISHNNAVNDFRHKQYESQGNNEVIGGVIGAGVRFGAGG